MSVDMYLSLHVPPLYSSLLAINQLHKITAKINVNAHKYLILFLEKFMDRGMTRDTVTCHTLVLVFNFRYYCVPPLER
jgi:hypothetical protein